jgi:hypothetical protein
MVQIQQLQRLGFEFVALFDETTGAGKVFGNFSGGQK